MSEGMGLILGADGKIHSGTWSMRISGTICYIDPNVEHPLGSDGYPLAAMRPIRYLAEAERLGEDRICLLCFEDGELFT